MTASNAVRRISPRSRGAVAAQAACASAAASRAATASSGVASAHVVSVPPVAGSWTSKRAPPLPSRHVPPMSSLVGTASMSDFWVMVMGSSGSVLGGPMRLDRG